MIPKLAYCLALAIFAACAFAPLLIRDKRR
jgi:hypothetical protein